MLDYNSAQFIHEATDEDGDKLISCDYLQYGGDDNGCAVERANVRYIKEQKLEAYRENGGYGGVKVWLLDTEENRELLDSLQNYPAFDDELVSQIEQKIEDDYIRDNDDIYRLYTPQPMKDILDDLDLRCIDPEVYYRAKDACNEYFTVKAGGYGYINLERIAKEYNLLLTAKYPAIQIIADLREQLDGQSAPPFPISYYESARDMLGHRDATGQSITPDEARSILLYAAELEEACK